MRYKIKDIGEGGLDLSVPVNQAWLTSECSETSVGLGEDGLRFEGRLEPAGEGYLLRGTLHGTLTASCARCLELAPIAIDSPMAVNFIEDAARDDEGDDDEGDDVLPFEHGVIDLGPPIRDEILLAVPMSPVCREDCAGICPSCGCNRNLTPCDCEKQAIETSKLAALAKIKLQ
jgi:uncharacterized metal-binding protein YceD (DUF177 family)